MTPLLKRIGTGVIGTAGVVALLTGCGQAPTTGSTTGASGSASAASTSAYLPCIVSDQGGFDDRSFNQLGLEGVQAAAKSLGSQYKQVQSSTANDYASNIDNLVAQKCNIVVASGFLLVDAVKAAATKSTSTDFAMIDDNSIDLPNVKDVVFNTNQAAFLGGYAAAAYSKTGVVATWGGIAIPPVTIYMDGIAKGVEYYNKQKNKDVKLLGWNASTQKGSFIGNFNDQNKAKTFTTNFLNQDADVIIPVAGSLYQGAGAAIKSSKKSAVLEGVDADVYETDTSGAKSLILVSILKNISSAAEAVVTQSAKEDTFDNAQYVGTLKNDGVGLSSFHDYESKLPAGLADELDTIKQGIIDGSIDASSKAQFSE